MGKSMEMLFAAFRMISIPRNSKYLPTTLSDELIPIRRELA